MLDFDSPEEKFFYDWILNLKEEGFIESVEYEPSFVLFPEEKITFTKLKGKQKVETAQEFSLLNQMTYSPDFKITWTAKARDLFFFTEGSLLKKTFIVSLRSKLLAKNIEGKYVSYVDVKGTFAARHNSSNIKFSLYQKMMFGLHGIYVQKVMPLHKKYGLFASTFTPDSYWLTEKKKKERKTAWQKITLEDYLSNQSTENVK